MKNGFLIAFLALAMLSSCSSTPRKASKPAPRVNGGKGGFAVVELYTSEGCSSCPPADRLLATLAQQYADRPVLFVGMHVDYWDRLDWKDPFSDHAFARRQIEYSGFFGNENVYTPQAIVNGSLETSGSNRNAILGGIEAGLSNGSEVTITLHAKRADGSMTVVPGSVALDYEAKGLPEKNRIVLLVVQRKAITIVENGENKGKTLAHVNVARGIEYRSAAKSVAVFAFPEDLKMEQDAFVAAFSQDVSNGHITGYAQCAIR